MDNQNNKKNDNNNRQNYGIIIITTIIAAVFVMFLYQLMQDTPSQEISYTKFMDMVEKGEVKEVTIDSEKITIIPKTEAEKNQENENSQGGITQGSNWFTQFGAGSQVQYYTGLIDDPDMYDKLDKAGVEVSSTIPDSTSMMILNLVFSVIVPFVLVFVLLSFLMRRVSKSSGGMMGIGKSNAKMYVEKTTGVTFRDVAGQDEAKESLQEVVDFLHNPGKYTGVGAKLPKGALLVGPPGTGKTLLAKAVAGEANVPFFSLSGSAFVEMYVGVGASRVRDLFKQAQQMAPCIIFIDEIDAIGKSRDSQLGGNDEREQTLNQLLAEMDGFDTNKGLLLLAATNRPEILDPALLRPGRFDRRIIVERPDLKGRVDILKVHAKEKKDRIMSQEERRIVSYHEVGHALVSALQKDSEPVQKITIVPRTMGALGYVMQTPEEEKFLNTKKELEAMLVGLLAGRAAEEIVFDTVTTGASNDIEKATKVARAMITQYGMSEKFGLIGLESIQNRYLDGRAVMNCGEATAAEIDSEVMQMLKVAYDEAKRLLLENREALDKIAAFLIEKETITGKEFMQIFHEVRGIADDSEKKEERIAMKPVETATATEKPMLEAEQETSVTAEEEDGAAQG